MNLAVFPPENDLDTKKTAQDELSDPEGSYKRALSLASQTAHDPQNSAGVQSPSRAYRIYQASHHASVNGIVVAALFSRFVSCENSSVPVSALHHLSYHREVSNRRQYRTERFCFASG